MNNKVYLNSWSNMSKMYELDIEDGRYKRVKHAKNVSKTAGVIKFFLFDKSLSVYKIKDDWWVQHKKNRVELKNKDLSFMCKRKGFFSYLQANFNTETFKFYDISLFPYLSQKIDPTFDALDLLAEDFFQWLYEIRHGTKEG